MPTDLRSWSGLCAGVLVLQLLALGSLPFELYEPWDKMFHILAYSALTLLLWMATDGRRPTLLIAGLMALGLCDELRQAFVPARGADILDFLADALAASATGAVLYWKTAGAKKPCVESSQP